jgi:hypothetical protein
MGRLCAATPVPKLKRAFICRSGQFDDNPVRCFSSHPESTPATVPLTHRPIAMLLAAAMSLCLGLSGAAAGGRDDHERARQALAEGQILPLATILERIAREHPGQMLEVELERKDDRWIYEIKQLQAGGVVVRLKVDARDGRVLEQRDHRGGKRGRGGDS